MGNKNLGKILELEQECEFGLIFMFFCDLFLLGQLHFHCFVHGGNETS